VESYKARRVATGKARATVNRELAALRRAYRLAVERKQVSPGRVPRIELFAEDNVRQGFVDYEDFQGLSTHLAPPLDDLTRFAYHSGWRKNEILTLCWTDINRGHTQATLRPEFSKNRETRQLPTLAEVIERRWQARLISSNGDSPRVCDLVFHRAGEPIRDFRGAWEAACTAIGKPNLLFHDLRRSAVRNLIQGGTPERVAMKITGHKTRAIFDRYHIVDSRDMEAALERTESRPAQIDHFPAQTACGRYRKRSS
jgi:integrase